MGLGVKVKLRKGKPAAQADVAALEEVVAGPLPADIKGFFAENDGAEPEPNICRLAGNNSLVDSFIPARKIPHRMAFIENLPAKSFPIARDGCGNYFIVNLSAGGTVHFWDHEEPEKLELVATSFSSFLDYIEPLEQKRNNLAPSPVKKVTISPAAQKLIERRKNE